MSTSSSVYVPRLPKRWWGAGGWLWVAWAAALVAPLWAFHLGYARNAHPALFPVLVAALVVAVAVLPPLYQRWRSRWWRHEARLATGLCLVALLFYEGRAAVVAAALLIVMLSVGRLALLRLGLETESVSARWSLALAAGLSILVWPLAALGLAGQFRPWPILGVMGAGAWIARRQVSGLGRALLQADREWAGSEELRRPVPGLLFPLAAILLAFGLVVALTPTIAFDPLKFHLPLARHYAETGKVTPLASDGYGYNPQNFEILLGAAYSLAGQAGAQLITPGFLAAFLLALFAVVRHTGTSRAAALAGCIFAAAIPFVHWSGVNMKHDVIVAFLHLAALLTWYEWRSSGRSGWIYLGTAFGAISLGFKHPAAFGLLGLAPLYAYALWDQPRRWRATLACSALGLSLGGFWLARSWALTGDAFFYYDVGQPLPPEHAAQVGTAARRLVNAVVWPYRIHFDGELFFRSFTPNPMGVALPALLPAWMLWKRRASGSNPRAALIFAGASLVPWGFYVPLLRFVIAPLSLLLALTVARCAEASEGSPPAWRRAALTAGGAAWLASLTVLLILEINVPQIRYLAGQIDRREYLRQALRTFPSLEALEGVAGPRDTVFGVQNCSRAYAPCPGRFLCDYYHPENAADRARLRQALQDSDCRYLILPTPNSRPEILEELTGTNRRVPVYLGEHYAVFRLEPEQPAPSSPAGPR